MTDIATKKLLGQPVIYVGTKGQHKAAFVLGTPESVEPGHVIAENPETSERIEIPVPKPGHLNLMIMSYSGFYPHFNVPHYSQAFDVLTQPAVTDLPLNLLERDEVGYWVLNESELDD